MRLDPIEWPSGFTDSSGKIEQHLFRGLDSMWWSIGTPFFDGRNLDSANDH
jgi:hypothetical protein